MKLLLIEDDEALAKLLIRQLTLQNYVVDRVADGETGWSYASTFDYDLILLDWMLPRLSGLQLCQRLREEGYQVPILLLTAREQQTDKLRGLESGADDYLVKPFDIDELLARIRVLVRRATSDPQLELTWDSLCLDPSSCDVTYRGRPVALTAKEYALLELFLRHRHQVFSASALLDQIWSSDEYPSEATARSHIRGLRQKLKAAGAASDMIETIRGLGYRLKTEAADGRSPEPPLQAKQRRYLKDMRQAWDTHKGDCVDRWQYLERLTQLPLPVSEQQRSHGRRMAHSLKGTLGTFGLLEGYRLAAQIEQLLAADDLQTAPQDQLLKTLVTALGHAIDASPQLVPWSAEAPAGPTVVAVDIYQTPYIQQLNAVAVAQGLTVSIMASVEEASEYLCADDDPPALVLINLVGNETDPLLDEASLPMLQRLMARFQQRWPQLPMLLITPQADFSSRLDLVRRGGTAVLEYPISPGEVIDTIRQIVDQPYQHSKIILVDDDSCYLQQIVGQLQPWQFQITPLASAQRFWALFSQILPDMVILDIEMPGISGFDLCKVLRSHSSWRHLPIIFLSSHCDRETQAQAFAAGADDYITKPVQGQELAFRIVHRLRRSSLAERPALG